MNKELDLLDIFNVKASKLNQNKNFICYDPYCVENAKYKIEFEYEQLNNVVYLCENHFNYIKINAMNYAVLNTLNIEELEAIPIILGDKKIVVAKIGGLNLILEAEQYLKDKGILEENEMLTTDIVLSLLRSQKSIAYADIVLNSIFVYSLDIPNNEYIITEKEWEIIKERLKEVIK